MNKIQSTTRKSKLWLLAAMPLLLATFSPLATAGGDRHFSSRVTAHAGHHRGGHRDYGRRHARQRHNGHRRHGRHYNRHQRRHYGHAYRRGYRHGHRRHSDRGAYLVGGLIAGSLLTHAFTRPQDRYTYNEYRTTRVISPAPVYRSTSQPRAGAVSRRLFRDRDGNCFERSHNEAGEELLIELPAEACAW